MGTHKFPNHSSVWKFSFRQQRWFVGRDKRFSTEELFLACNDLTDIRPDKWQSLQHTKALLLCRPAVAHSCLVEAVSYLGASTSTTVCERLTKIFPNSNFPQLQATTVLPIHQVSAGLSCYFLGAVFAMNQVQSTFYQMSIKLFLPRSRSVKSLRLLKLSAGMSCSLFRVRNSFSVVVRVSWNLRHSRETALPNKPEEHCNGNVRKYTFEGEFLQVRSVSVNATKRQINGTDLVRIPGSWILVHFTARETTRLSRSPQAHIFPFAQE